MIASAAIRTAAVLALAGAQSPALAPAAAPVDPEPWRVVYPRPETVAVSGGVRRVDSLLKVDGPLRFGDHAWHDVAKPGEVWVRVDLDRQMVSVFRGGDEIGTAVVLFGSDGKRTPRGAFRVLERDRDHVSSLYDAAMPFMLRLKDTGIAIHASDVRRGAATHGCIGVPPAFARLLYDAARRGTVVYVV